MKKVLITLLAILFLNTSNAQNITEWRLSKSAYKGPDWTGLYVYSYDSSNRLKQVKYYQDNKIFTTSANFKYNADNNITYYEDHFTKGKYGPKDPSIYYFTYDAKGKLQKKEVHKIKEGKDKVVQSFIYEWSEDKVIVTDNLSTFGGMATTTRTYTLDSKKNITSIESKMNKQVSTDNFSNYDNHPNPNLFTSYPFEQSIVSAGKPTILNYSFGEEHDVVQVNAAGLVIKVEEHYITTANAPVNYTTYSYTKVNKK